MSLHVGYVFVTIITRFDSVIFYRLSQTKHLSLHKLTANEFCLRQSIKDNAVETGDSLIVTHTYVKRHVGSVDICGPSDAPP